MYQRRLLEAGAAGGATGERSCCGDAVEGRSVEGKAAGEEELWLVLRGKTVMAVVGRLMVVGREREALLGSVVRGRKGTVGGGWSVGIRREGRLKEDENPNPRRRRFSLYFAG
uniref:Uncharacterized protein n=1 Tax=Populus alba TaxID=43335 RepID=A0A4V5ZY17_POPAL|nr:hypothetical protein D5086_0000323970 [Populus alba]